MVDSNFLHSLDVPEICMYIFIQIKEYCILYSIYCMIYNPLKHVQCLWRKAMNLPGLCLG